jgi:hypothetical protein
VNRWDTAAGCFKPLGLGGADVRRPPPGVGVARRALQHSRPRSRRGAAARSPSSSYSGYTLAEPCRGYVVRQKLLQRRPEMGGGGPWWGAAWQNREGWFLSFVRLPRLCWWWFAGERPGVRSGWHELVRGFCLFGSLFVDARQNTRHSLRLSNCPF